MKNTKIFFNKDNFSVFMTLLYLFVFLNIVCYSNSLIQAGKYPYVKRLNNGKYIILSSNSIIFTDSDFNQTEKTIDFETEVYSFFEFITSTTCSQFKSGDGSYIMAIILNKLYFFSSNGELLNTYDLQPYLNGKYSSSLIPNGHSGNDYFFTFIYASGDSGINSDCSFLNFKKGKFDSSNKQITFYSDIYQFSPLEYTQNKFQAIFSCDIMKKNNKEYIACFYGHTNLICSLFDPENYTEFQTKVSEYGLGVNKVAIAPNGREKALLCTYISSLNCYNYDINNNEFSPGQKTVENGCENYQSALILDYFYETNKFVAGCLGNNAEFYISTFNEQLSWDESSAKISSVGQNIGKVGIINIILPSGQTKYNAFTSPIQGCNIVTCDSIQAQFDLDITIVNTYPTGESSDLVCSFPDYYNYEKTNCITEISEGYYCNSTEKRTIDKCHNNCKSCQQGGDDNSNNCLTCKDGLYYNLGNCVERSLCTNDVFTDGSINKCKCIQQSKCLLCDSTSLSYSKCLSCNTDSHYYPKQEDINNHNTYIECYNSESIGNGFILNSENHYAQCYEN